MKKCITLAIVLTLLLSLNLTAHADVIWEPYGDRFYEDHREQFSYCGYMAYTNSPDGVTQTYTKPGGNKGKTIDNGVLVNIQHSYDGGSGDVWALLEENVYVPMEHLLNRYDDEFFADHPEIVDNSNQPDITVEIPVGTPILTWTYPRGVSSAGENYWDADILSGCQSFYTDEAGLIWGYMGYWYGRQNTWICLSDYNNPELAEPEIYLGQTHWADGNPGRDVLNDGEIKPGRGSWLQVVLPVGAVLVAGGLLLFWPRKKKTGQPE